MTHRLARIKPDRFGDSASDDVWPMQDRSFECGPVPVIARRRTAKGKQISKAARLVAGSETLVNLATLLAANLSQSTRMSAIEAKLDSLAHASCSFETEINALANPSLSLLKPIRIRIREVDAEEYSATFFDASIEASGESEAEVFRNIVDVIESKFLVLSGMRGEELAPVIARQLGILQQFVEYRN